MTKMEFFNHVLKIEDEAKKDGSKDITHVILT